ncbi:alpha/beta hydrolase [Oligoflexus tunisiensis]|uniref:alpha/beta hydrolase n=1 Tax=Oligoflexus tunisiensis TaxID=708132 RepID=UPI00114CE5C4|nr:alpha/beta hydrolase [Oligoflexus tunisiensis]
MKKQLVSLAFLALFAVSCQTSYSARPHPTPAGPSPEQELWNDYVKETVASHSIPSECQPRRVQADPTVGRRGLLMFFHGFNACPQEFATLSERLAKAGFDVYLPLLPESSHRTLDRPELRYKKFITTMNEIARRAPRGDKVLAGLSGGGSLATEAALVGPGVWDRLLIFAPRATESLDAIARIRVPMQFVGVLHEATVDADAIQSAVEKARNARLCFYPEGVPHAMLQPESAASGEDAYWLPALEQDALSFITSARWFLTNQIRPDKKGWPICRYIL